MDFVEGRLGRRGAIKLAGGAAAAAAGLAVVGGTAMAAGTTAAYTGAGVPWVTIHSATVATPSTMFSATTWFGIVQRGAGLNTSSGGTDDLSYLYASASGDGTYTALVRRVGPTNSDGGNGAVGIMARSSGAANAANVAVMVTDGNGVTFQWRLHDGDPEESWPMSIAIGVSAPIWVQLARKGSSWTVQYSQNGVNWYNPTSTAVILPSSYLVGIAAYTTSKRLAKGEVSNCEGFTPNTFASIM